jgi:hypothetical protein
VAWPPVRPAVGFRVGAVPLGGHDRDASRVLPVRQVGGQVGGVPAAALVALHGDAFPAGDDQVAEPAVVRGLRPGDDGSAAAAAAGTHGQAHEPGQLGRGVSRRSRGF